MGYSLTSDTVPQTRLWEMATYDMKPRLNRISGVSTVVVQGGQEPEFEMQPDPAKLLQTAITIPNILDAIGRSNMIDSPGLIENNHQLVLSLVSGQARTPDEIANIVVKTTPAGAPVQHRRRRLRCCHSVKPVYTDRHGEREAGGAAEHLPAARQQHGRGGRRGSRGDRRASANAAARASSCSPSTTSRKS